MDSGPRPFSIKIFLPDGNPDGLKIIDRSNWTGRAIAFPRSLLTDIKPRQEFAQTGVYVLVGPSEDSALQMIYVGEGDPVSKRLESHHSQKDFWTWAIFFVSKDDSLNKAHVEHLESRLIELARESKRANLDNQNNPTRPTLSEPETADVESFLADVLSIFPLVGLSAFEKPPVVKSEHELLKLEAKGISAQGYESGQGFVVLKDSRAVSEEVPSIVPYLTALRRELQERDVLAPQSGFLELTQDYVFNSPSTAAGVLLGRSSNGRTMWKDSEGRTLKRLQEMMANEKG